MTDQVASDQVVLLGSEAVEESAWEAFDLLRPLVVRSEREACEAAVRSNGQGRWIAFDPATIEWITAAGRCAEANQQVLGDVLLLYLPDSSNDGSQNAESQKQRSAFQRLHKFHEQGVLRRLAYGQPQSFLPLEELADLLAATDRESFFLGGLVNEDAKELTLWKGNFEGLRVPFHAFPTTALGQKPDFSRFAVIDYGAVIRLGDYESTSDVILCQFDSAYQASRFVKS